MVIICNNNNHHYPMVVHDINSSNKVSYIIQIGPLINNDNGG